MQLIWIKLNLYIYENKNVSEANLNQGCICENKNKSNPKLTINQNQFLWIK